jgi:acyl-ACP thioesterase
MSTGVFLSQQCIATNSDVDFMQRFRISRLFNWLQDSAGAHVEKMGLGLDVLPPRYGLAWVIMRIRAEIGRLPRLGEPVTLETWPLRPRTLFDRDFTIADASGSIIVRAISTWILMNIKKRELIKSIPPLFHTFDFREKRAMDYKMKQLKAPGELSPAYEKIIRYSDADYNGHTNNTRYLDYSMDCLEPDFLRDHAIRSVEVNFVNESVYGDRIQMFHGRAPADLSYYVEGRRESGQKENPHIAAGQADAQVDEPYHGQTSRAVDPGTDNAHPSGDLIFKTKIEFQKVP